MKELPILFSTPMVQAILAGTKTQTRRVVKGHSLDFLNAGFTPKYVADKANQLCPYGYTGDLLWVRETFQFIDYWADSKAVHVLYEDGKPLVCNLTDQEWAKFMKWQDPCDRKPSLFLFKSCSRIWLQKESIRIERLNEISEDDAKAEGVECWIEERMRSKPIHYKIYSDYDNPTDPALYSSTAVCSYETLWRKINGKDSWAENPWVWVITYKVLSTTGRPQATATLSPGEGRGEAYNIKPAGSLSNFKNLKA